MGLESIVAAPFTPSTSRIVYLASSRELSTTRGQSLAVNTASTPQLAGCLVRIGNGGTVVHHVASPVTVTVGEVRGVVVRIVTFHDSVRDGVLVEKRRTEFRGTSSLCRVTHSADRAFELAMRRRTRPRDWLARSRLTTLRQVDPWFAPLSA